MKRIAILVAAALLLPSATGAQVARPADRGITVPGSAESRVPATSARVTLELVSADRRPMFDAQRIQPVIDALTKAGADPASVRVPLDLDTPGAWSTASISATFSQPSAFDQVAADGSCSANYTVGQYSGGGFAGPLAAGDFASVPIHATLSVTYAIK